MRCLSLVWVSDRLSPDSRQMHSGTFWGLSLQTEAITLNIWSYLSIDVNRDETEGCRLRFAPFTKARWSAWVSRSYFEPHVTWHGRSLARCPVTLVFVPMSKEKQDHYRQISSPWLGGFLSPVCPPENTCLFIYYFALNFKKTDNKQHLKWVIYTQFNTVMGP